MERLPCMRNAILSFWVSSLLPLSSDFRFGLAARGWDKIEAFSQGHDLGLRQYGLVMKDWQCSAKVCLFSDLSVWFLVLHIYQRNSWL